MREQQSNHKRTEKNPKGWRKRQTNDMGTSTRTRTHARTRTHGCWCGQVIHCERQQSLTQGHHGHPSCSAEQEGGRRRSGGGARKKGNSPSNHLGRRAGQGDTLSALTPPWFFLSPRGRARLASPAFLAAACGQQGEPDRVAPVCRVGQRLPKATAVSGGPSSKHPAARDVPHPRPPGLPPWPSPRWPSSPGKGVPLRAPGSCRRPRAGPLPLGLDPRSLEPSENQHSPWWDLESITAVFLEFYKHALAWLMSWFTARPYSLCFAPKGAQIEAGSWSSDPGKCHEGG